MGDTELVKEKEDGSQEEDRNEDFEELSESSYTSDFEDDDPVSCLCDLPEDEAAAFRAMRKQAAQAAEEDGLNE